MFNRNLTLEEMERLAYITNDPMHKAISAVLDARASDLQEVSARAYAMGYDNGYHQALDDVAPE